MKKYAYAIFIATITLFGIGLLVLMSASSMYSMHNRAGLFSIFYSQLGKGAIGFMIMLGLAMMPYQRLKKISKYLLIAMILILIVTVSPLMPKVNHVHRWFVLGPVRFQPAEVAKLLLIIHLANLLEQKKEVIRDFEQGYRYPLIWTGIIGLLIIIQPSVSNCLIVVSASYFMMVVADAAPKHLWRTFAAGAIPVIIAAVAIPYVRGRIIRFLNCIINGGYYDNQVYQAMLGLGNGGLMGMGLGNSWQRNLHLPEAYGDFIFSIAGEEMGLLGTMLILSLFFMIFFTGIIIAKNAKDMFGQLLAFGISFMLFAHVLIHVPVSLGLMPPTGIPLPFVSHGGTILLVMFAAIGILINIGMQSAEVKKEKEVLQPV